MDIRGADISQFFSSTTFENRFLRRKCLEPIAISDRAHFHVRALLLNIERDYCGKTYQGEGNTCTFVNLAVWARTEADNPDTN